MDEKNDMTGTKSGAPSTPVNGGTQATSLADGISVEKSGSPTQTLGNGEDDVAEMQRRSSVVQALARSYSRASKAGGGGDNPFLAGEDSPLNPLSANFSGKEWCKAVVELVTQTGASFRSSGICFQNMNVHGFGEATDYQGNVANVWVTLASMMRGLVSPTRQRIDILRQFDGIVRQGEMLVVLGPPGSGCSTFLKTIAGEMNGLYVDNDSYFNYQGESQDRQTIAFYSTPSASSFASTRCDVTKALCSRSQI